MIVSDTSPICNLALIGKLNLLRDELGTIHIPQAVATELFAWKRARAKQDILDAIKADWIKTAEIRDRTKFDQLIKTEELDNGEAEAIVLARETGSKILLMDEIEGRRVAQANGLTCTGVLGILVTARHKGRIHSLQEVIKQLRFEARFFVSPALEKLLLQSVGE